VCGSRRAKKIRNASILRSIYNTGRALALANITTLINIIKAYYIMTQKASLRKRKEQRDLS